ncbi:MAG: aminotransferase class IV [Aestuariivirga sp.]
MSATWLNGAPLEAELPLPVDDRGLLLGDGIFETIAAFNGVALYLESHLTRLSQTGEALGINFDSNKVRVGITHVLKNGGLRHGVLRVTVTRGALSGPFAQAGGTPNILVTLKPRRAGALGTAVALSTSSIRRNETAPSSRYKTLSYIDAIAAAREAARLGNEDALMLDSRGHVACSTICNIFVAKGRELATPSLDCGVLPGIVRRRVLDMASGIGFDMAERRIKPEELLSADSVFLTNSLRFVRPCHSIDGQRINRGGTELIFDMLCDEAQKICGCDPRAADAA